MKISTLLTTALMVTSLFVKAQETHVTFIDNFDGTNKYFPAQDFDFADRNKSIWHGFVYNSGLFNGDHPCIVTQVAEEDTVLVFRTKDGAWEGNHDSGAILYRNIENGADFEVEVHLVGGDFTTFMGEGKFKYHNSAGIICRSVNPEVYDAVYLMFFDLWNIHHMIKSMDNGTQTEFAISKDPTKELFYDISEYAWIKLKKVGTLFTAFTSKDGKEWIETVKVDRPDFEGVNMQVGLTQCNFVSHNTDWAWIEDESYYTEAKLDNFKLTHDIEGLPSFVNDAMANNSIKAFYQNGTQSIVVSSSSAAISKVKVFDISGKLVKTVQPNSKLATVAMEQKGFYMVSIETNAGSITQKVIVNQ